jgi:hypothetical protein
MGFMLYACVQIVEFLCARVEGCKLQKQHDTWRIEMHPLETLNNVRFVMETGIIVGAEQNLGQEWKKHAFC